ncbi:putative lipase/esterase [Aspergillus lucknowensis]|uniref:Alpha/Beta hydrolase protein n=1 Tax=Aspergillus lucknowensis TaxID=176173 RepID=A0ABR4LWS5_9EURO
MAVHPEWAAFQQQNPDLKHDDDQRSERFLSSPAGRPYASRVSTHDTAIPARDNYQIPIRIYTPSGHQSSSSLVIFFHSGGFTAGSLETEDVSCRIMALGAPAVVISVDYRLSPAYKFPVPINDGLDAFHYIANNVADLIPAASTPVNLVLSGTSSGGHLAAIVSQHARGWLAAPGNEKVTANIVLSGVLLRAPVTVNAMDVSLIPPQFRDVHRSWSAQYEGAEASRLSMRYNHDTLGVPESLKTNPEAYPLWGDFSGLPKTYIQICELDILRDDAGCYAQALEEAGVEVRQAFYKGVPHIFWIHSQVLGVAREAQEDCVRGLKWLLGVEDSE